MIIKNSFSWSLINREGILSTILYEFLFTYLKCNHDTAISMVDLFKFDRSFSEQDETISLRNILRRIIPQRRF